VSDEPDEERPVAAAGRYALVVHLDEVASVVVFAGTLGEVRRRRAELPAAEARRATVEEVDGPW
jgi:hypothetical protein